MINNYIENREIYSSHEHIGSLISFGTRPDPLFPSDVTPSLSPGKTGLIELIFSPYLASLIFENGCNFPLPEETEEDRFGDFLIKLMKAFDFAKGTGVYESLIIAFRHLYGMDINEINTDKEKLIDLNNRISDNYSNYFKWYEEVMAKSKTRYLLKPVHPEYFVRLMNGEGTDEIKFSLPILRVDSLIGFPDKNKILDFGGVYEASGIDIKDIDSLEEAIKWTFSMVEKSGCKSIKQLQAYYRPVDIADISMQEAKKSLELIMKSRKNKDKISKETIYTYQDYVMKRILEEANKRQLPYQIHTGMTTLKNSSPGLLEGTFKKYKDVKFVLLHTYPFLSEACYLARTNSNVYLDTSWQVLQSEGILKKALNEWIGMVPFYKITSSIDATNLEEYYGGQVMSKRVLTNVLEEKVNSGELSIESAMQISDGLLYKNAEKIYENGGN